MQTIAKSRFFHPHKQQDFLEINHSIFAKKSQLKYSKTPPTRTTATAYLP